MTAAERVWKLEKFEITFKPFVKYWYDEDGELSPQEGETRYELPRNLTAEFEISTYGGNLSFQTSFHVEGPDPSFEKPWNFEEHWNNSVRWLNDSLAGDFSRTSIAEVEGFTEKLEEVYGRIMDVIQWRLALQELSK